MLRVVENPKELILSTASLIAHEEGLASINMRSIAKKCDIGLGTIYNYFPTKMDLVNAITQNFWDECFKEFHHAFDPHLDFFKQLEVLYFYMLNYLSQIEDTSLKNLSTLFDFSDKDKIKELPYMNHFIHVLDDLIETNLTYFNQTFYNILGKQNLIKFIFSNFITMLINNDSDYEYFNTILKRILTSKHILSI